jgi:hypothetical protein
VQRTAVCIGDPDTFLSQSARVTVAGETVPGFLRTKRVRTCCLRQDIDHDCHHPDGRLDLSRPLCSDGQRAEVQDEVWVFTAYRYANNVRLIDGEPSSGQGDRQRGGSWAG